MRRIAPDFVDTAIARSKPALEEYIGQHLRCPEPFPFALTDTVAALKELRGIHVNPRCPEDYPPVDITISMHVLPTAKARRRDEDLGLRTFTANVEVRALGAV